MPKDHWKSERDKEARQKRARDIRQQKEREAEERSFTQTGPVDLSEDVQQRHHEESRLRLKKTALGKFRPDVARGSKAPTHFSGEFLVNPFGLTADILADVCAPAIASSATDPSLEALAHLAKVVKDVSATAHSGAMGGKGTGWSVSCEDDPRGVLVTIRIPTPMYCDVMAKNLAAEGKKQRPALLPAAFQDRWERSLQKFEAVRQGKDGVITPSGDSQRY